MGETRWHEACGGGITLALQATIRSLILNEALKLWAKDNTCFNGICLTALLRSNWRSRWETTAIIRRGLLVVWSSRPRREALTLALRKQRPEFANRLDVRHGRTRSQGDSRCWGLSHSKEDLPVKKLGKTTQELEQARAGAQFQMHQVWDTYPSIGIRLLVMKPWDGHAQEMGTERGPLAYGVKTKKLYDITHSVRRGWQKK